ncbi:glycoprotein E49 [Elephant endotheliotropic herpesvirus 2]|nr:glycoprotein E49 [Elephant endotheliotropic herpesvirus 2]
MGGGLKLICALYCYMCFNVIFSDKDFCQHDDDLETKSKNLTITGLADKINITLPLEINGTHILKHNNTKIENTTSNIYINGTHIILDTSCSNNGSGKYLLQSNNDNDMQFSCQLFNVSITCFSSYVNSVSIVRSNFLNIHTNFIAIYFFVMFF